MRRLRTPENYISRADAAKMLRGMADRLVTEVAENQMVRIDITFWFAETQDVEANMAKKFPRRGYADTSNDNRS